VGCRAVDDTRLTAQVERSTRCRCHRTDRRGE
jgi:hypothetical protein